VNAPKPRRLRRRPTPADERYLRHAVNVGARYFRAAIRCVRLSPTREGQGKTRRRRYCRPFPSKVQLPAFAPCQANRPMLPVTRDPTRRISRSRRKGR
jgi:hypothetical protein